VRGAVSGGRGRWAALLALALAATAVAAWSASHLRIATRIEELLPEGSPAAAAYQRFLATFGGFEKVYVLVLWEGAPDAPEAPDAALLAAAADRLAGALAGAPEVARVRSGLAPGDEEFLRRQVLPRAPLFLGDEAAVAAAFEPAAVRERVAELRRAVVAPGGATQARWLAADPLGVSGGLEALTEGGSLGLVDPLTGAFLSPAGDAALVLVTPAGGELDAAAGRALATALDRAYDAVRAAFPEAPLAFAAVGGPLYAAQDEAVLRADLVRTISGSALLVALLLFAYFGTWGTPLAVLASVAAGVAWTGGATAALHGEISVLGVSFAALLLGLGVDYGIHGASRFRSARLGGAAPADSLRAAVRDTGPAILASVATTAAAFLVLSLAHFRPVREMGQVMAGGVVAILAATLLVGAPALAVAGHLSRPPAPGSRRAAPWRWLGRGSAVLVRAGARRPGASVLLALLLTVPAAWGLTRLELSIDLRALRPADHPAFRAEALLFERFALGLDASTVVIEGRDLDTALARARRVEAALREVLPPEAALASPARWLPYGEVVERRRAALAGEPARRAATALRGAIAEEGLAPAPFAPALEVLDALGRGETPPRVPPEEWPDWVGDLVAPVPDAASPGGGVAVALRLSTPLGTWPDGPPPAVLAAVEAAAPGAAVASVPRLGAELRRVVLDDFRRLGGWALAAVLAVVLIAFRGRPRPSLLALLPVALGSLWTLGLAGLLAVPLDPFTVVVAPLLVGIGIDDGLHALAGARVHGGLAASLTENGRAMALTTLTTCAGFGSLMASRVPSLRAGGLLIAAGTAFCLLATLWLLPAVDAMTGGRRRAGGAG
jgi:uncharacterized protein